MHHITPSELIAWLTLTQIPDAGPSTIMRLLQQFDSAEALCRADPRTLQHHQLNDAQIHAITHPNQRWIDATLAWQTQPHHAIIPLNDPRYPALLKEISPAPLLIYVDGDFKTLSQPQLAVVGSRNPTHSGRELAQVFSYHLSQVGLIVTSGLALGIDTAAHQGALEANGKTIAVLGCGLQKIYPKSNAALAERIRQNGCLVSELPLQAEPAKHHFPQRNRIISGQSLGTLVIEAALKSGSLITARLAAEQGREVFALPGSIRNPQASGCLSLIQNGAKCVTQLEDILQEIQWDPSHLSVNNVQNTHQTTLAPTNNPVLACIDNEVTTIDQICARSKLSAHLVTAELTRLELDGHVKRQFGGFILLSNDRSQFPRSEHE